MRITILTPDKDIEAARKHTELFPQFSRNIVLGNPLSPTGEAPVTHWYCNFEVDQEMADKIVKEATVSETDVVDLRKFLKKKGLKIINKRCRKNV